METEDHGYPVSLFVGTLTGLTRKQSRDYVVGLARAFCEVPELTAYRLTRRPEGGYDYEIQEAGTGRAILEEMRNALHAHGEVYLPLANGRYVELANNDGRLVSLIGYQMPQCKAVDWPEGGKRMTSLQGDARWVARMGRAVLAGGVFSALAMIGSAWMIQDPREPVLVDWSDPLPVQALRERMDRLESDEYIAAMRHRNGRYIFEIRGSD